jgi:hypothetical protein
MAKFTHKRIFKSLERGYYGSYSAFLGNGLEISISPYLHSKKRWTRKGLKAAIEQAIKDHIVVR